MSSGRPLKVLHVLDSLGMGGAETWLMELMRHWSRSGPVRMHFLATSGGRGVFDDEATHLGGKIHYLKYGRKSLATFIPEYRRILERERYDAIHDHGDLASGWHFLLGLGCLPPVRVAHVHNAKSHLSANYAVTPSRRVITRSGRELVRRLATHVCGTSAQALHEYGFELRAKRPSVSVLHCGFNVQTFNAPGEADRASVTDEFGLPADAEIVLFVGRLDRENELNHFTNSKNSWLAALICRAAAERNPQLHLLMAGDGDEQRHELERRIASWGLSDRLRLIGVRKDIPRLMRASHALLFPSVEEGLGMVAVEAQAAGLPVVASTAIPVEARVIAPLFRTVDLGDPLEVWAKAVLEALAMERPSREQCRAAIEQSDFSVTRSASRLRAIYASARR
jgi:glycosyltransferase involved in cell wall biosynthesis